MTRLTEALLVIMIFAAPFGEGGRSPGALCLIQSLALAVVALFALRRVTAASDGGAAAAPWRSITAGLAAALSLCAVAALRAAYPLAGGLGLWDLLLPSVLFLALLHSEERAALLPRVGRAVALSSLVQAGLALFRWARAEGLGAGALAAGRSFLNPDHLGAFLNLGLVLWLEAALSAGRRGEVRAKRLALAASGVHFLAILVLMSRGSIVGLVAALLLLFALRRSVLAPRQRTVVLGLLALALMLGSGMVLLRFARSADPYKYHRLQIWRACTGMILERPWLGFGPGMLRHEAASHNFPSDVGPFRFEKVFSGGHSAFLTLATETGLPAAIGLALVALGVIGRLLRSQGAGLDRWDGRAIGIGLSALATQGLFEDLQERPALVFIASILAAAALRVRTAATELSGGRVVPAPGASGRSSGERTLAATLVALGAIYLFAIAVLMPYWADREARLGVQEGRAGLSRMQRAGRLSPWQPDIRHNLAMAVLNSGPPGAERYAEAALLLDEARRLDPIDARFPLLLGRLEARLAASLFKDGAARERSIRLYEEAVRLSPRDPRPLLELGGEQMETGSPESALRSAREALLLEPNFLRARILETTCLLALGRAGDARTSYAQLVATLRLLEQQPLTSGYARDLAEDAPAERARLAAQLGAGADPAAPGSPRIGVMR